jgi:hypothetical protein
MENTTSKRVRCSDDMFLEAIYSSNTYAEISEKTGQKIATTMARYLRVKNTLEQQGISIPKMQRKKPVKSVDNIQNLVATAKRLQAYMDNQ